MPSWLTFIMLTRLSPGAVRSPQALEQLERKAMERADGTLRRSFDDRDLGSIDRYRDGGDENCAEHDVLSKDVHAEERHADTHHGNDQRPDERAPDAPDASGYGRSSDDDRGDRREQKLSRQSGRSARQPPGKDHAGKRGEGRREDEGKNLLPADLHAGGIGRRLARTDCGAVAPKLRVGLQNVGGDQHDEPHDDDIRRPERLAGDPGLMSARGVVQHDGALLGDH